MPVRDNNPVLPLRLVQLTYLLERLETGSQTAFLETVWKAYHGETGQPHRG
jgi:hypothetical protein